MARNLELISCLSLLINRAQFILENENMFPLPLKIHCAWHLHPFVSFLTLSPPGIEKLCNSIDRHRMAANARDL